MAEICGKYANNNQSQLARRSGDDAKPRPRRAAALFVDQILRVGEAASALRFLAEQGIGLLGGAGAGASELAKLVLSDGVADADDHERLFTAIATHSQVTSSGQRCVGAHQPGEKALVRGAEVGERDALHAAAFDEVEADGVAAGGADWHRE